MVKVTVYQQNNSKIISMSHGVSPFLLYHMMIQFILTVLLPLSDLFLIPCMPSSRKASPEPGPLFHPVPSVVLSKQQILTVLLNE